MRFIRVQILSITILILFLNQSLMGSVLASYSPESAIVLQKCPGVFSHPNMFGAKLGRLTVTSDEVMYNPTILVAGMTGGYDIWLIGPYRWDSNNDWEYDKRIQMNLLAVSYPYGLGGGVFIRALSGKQPLLSGWNNEQVVANPFVVDLYLVNSNDNGGTTNTGITPNLNTNGGFFKLDSPFIFETPINYGFTVGITNTLAQGPWVFPASGDPTLGQFIPIDGVVGQGSTPVIDPGSYTDGEPGEVIGFWYGDGVPQPVFYNFWFDAPVVNFDLSDAYDTNMKEITKAYLQVVTDDSNCTYTQNIAFTTDDGSERFQLCPDFPGGAGIEFNLFFGTRHVDYGETIQWMNLVRGTNWKELYISGINANEVEQMVSGTYQVTIIANITNAD